MPNTKYKPPTVIADDGTSASAFSRHVQDMTKQYGSVTAINLVNQHGSEGNLAESFARHVARLPTDTRFQLVPFDFHKECGSTSYECAPPPPRG